ncbi:MAG: histidine triad nucleotide-binding protein [Clostridia bacterium]|nr:histidine triad nucleotide-binding protein [Clostridia bacterium]
MENCLFCKIIAGDIPSERVYEDDRVIAIRDIDPQAPLHVLVMPKEHVQDMTAPGAAEVADALFRAAAKIVSDAGLSESGFRAVLNTGRDGGQTVLHMHMHVLGGRSLQWPPG